MTSNRKIVIGVPSFRRPKGLRRLLDSISRAHLPYDIRVIVADNDGENGEACHVVTRLQKHGYQHPLEKIGVEQRGISYVRNKLICTAFYEHNADALVMVDDDERVDPNWLKALVAMQEETGAHVVAGLVQPEFITTPPPWVHGLNIYFPPLRLAGIVSSANNTGNVLLHRSFLQFDTRFDPGFGLTGGGDAEFFKRLQLLGATFAFAPASTTHELFGESRVTKRWALERSYRIGAGDARIISLHASSRGERAFAFTKAACGVPVAACGAVLFILHDRLGMKWLTLLARQLGKVAGWLRRSPEVYRITHGT